MNAPHDPSDPLLNSLADETADLPACAALAARRRTAQRRQTRRQFTQAAVIVMVAFITWKSLPSHDSGTKPADSTPPAKPVALANLPATNPPADPARVLPTGLNEDQRRFIESVPDIPMLLVRDDSGKVTRIHIVER